MQVEGFMGYGREILCAFAGPAVNLILALSMTRMKLFAFSGLNLAMGLFNLLPLRTLDGGRVLSCAACAIFDPERVHWLIARLEWILSMVLLLCGGIVAGLGGNVTLVVVAVWLLGALCRATE